MEPQNYGVLDIVAHDLKHPLFCIEGYADLLLTKSLDPQARQDYLTRILSANQLAQSILKDLSDTAAIERGDLTIHPSEVRLAAVVREVVEAFEGQCKSKGVVLTLAPQQARTIVWVDRLRLSQVLHNLLANALRHVAPETGAITVSLEQRRGLAVVTVADNGVGIEREHLDRIFERYYQVTRDSSASFGLGLFIARHMIEQAGGSIGASSPGRGLGSTFSLSLPMLQPGASPACAQLLCAARSGGIARRTLRYALALAALLGSAGIVLSRGWP